jgi:hypothetical protein
LQQRFDMVGIEKRNGHPAIMRQHIRWRKGGCGCASDFALHRC